MILLLVACTGPKPADRAPAADPTAETGTVPIVGTAHTGLTEPTDPTDPTAATGHTGTTATTGHTGSPVPTWPDPDFHLVDLNPVSPTSGTIMSPRDELGKVSGWYFTHAS